MQFSFTTVQALALLYSTVASAASLQQYTNWGANPGNLPRVDIYVPDRLAPNPPVILGLHPCGGTGSQFHGSHRLAQQADQLGFILVYPTSKSQSGMNCWDVHSSASLRRDGGGESTSVANVVKSVLTKYNGDPNKVFVTGASSGAMMTNNMLGLYPDLFEAGAPNAGVPAACFTGAQSSNPSSPDQSCAQATKNNSPSQWGDLARSLYPGYTGKRPRVMVLHGTADGVTRFGNYQHTLDQWANVMGLTASGERTNTPQSSWTEKRYGDGSRLVGYAVQGGGHIIQYNEAHLIQFFGITAGNTATGAPAGPTSTAPGTTPTSQPPVTPITTTTPPPFTPPPQTGTVAEWGQCGGINYNGPTGCQSGLRCNKINDYYHQCVR